MDIRSRQSDTFPMNNITPSLARSKRGEFAPTAVYAAPEGETERRLLALWEEVLHIDGIGVADDFFELGGDSLAGTTLLVGIERDFNQTLPLADLQEYSTIRRLAARLEQLRLLAGERPLVAIRITGHRPPLFVVHAAAGDVFFVSRLRSHLEQEQPLYGLQARGLEDGETPHQRFEAMADDYIAAIRKVQPRGPYFLGGYCIGGLIAMVMSQRLQAAGERVALLFMIDPDFHPGAVPWLYWRNPDAPHIRLLLPVHRFAWAIQPLILRLRRKLTGSANPDMPPSGASESWRQKSVSAGMRRALRAYRPTLYDGEVTIFCSSERRSKLNNRPLGMQTKAREATFIEIAPTHFDVFRSRLPVLAKQLQGLLDRAHGGSSPAGS
jgi:acyl carrier protein